MQNFDPKNHSSFARLQRPSLVPKTLLWSFLAVLFFMQQIATTFAGKPEQTLQAATPFGFLSPEALVSLAAVLVIGFAAGWLLWERARMTQR